MIFAMQKMISLQASRNGPRSQSQCKKSRNSFGFKAVNKEAETPKASKKDALFVSLGNVRTSKSQTRNSLKKAVSNTASTPKGNARQKLELSNDVKRKVQKKMEKTLKKKTTTRTGNLTKNLSARAIKPEPTESKDMSQSFYCKNILPLNLSVILDTSLEEDYSSNEENTIGELVSSTNDSESISTSIGGSQEFAEKRQGLFSYKGNKNACSTADLRPEMFMKGRQQERLTMRNSLIRSKTERDTNARKHFVRGHLNELYTRILFKIKTHQKNRKN